MQYLPRQKNQLDSILQLGQEQNVNYGEHYLSRFSALRAGSYMQIVALKPFGVTSTVWVSFAISE